MEVILKPTPLATALALAALVASHAAAATLLYDRTVAAADTIGGSSVELDGTLDDTNGISMPWTAELFAQAGDCMRLAVTTSFDSKLTVTAPNGSVYRDDDSGGQERPLVKIAGAPISGWYTVQVAHFGGLPQVSHFTLKYGRHAGGSANCAGATLPLPAGMSEAAKGTPHVTRHISEQ
jgi:hypothetical protein